MKWKTAIVVAAVVLGSSVFAATAAASTVLSEGWESGTLDGWTAADTSTSDGQNGNDPQWQVLNNPQNVSVASPGINPNLVTLPDPGHLPSANGGTHAAWFGDTTSGTFCGADWNTYSGTPNTTASKNGCTSREAFSGMLTSPTFSLANAASATLHFFAWWEIEGVNSNSFDLMQVQYSSDGGTTWSSPVQLNPVSNPAGGHDQSYSNNGLEVSPSWHEYLVDLSPAINSSTVKIRFLFNTADALYNGFRGWLIDDIAVNTPQDAGSPTISSAANSCSGGQGATTVVNGSNFIEGSTLLVDGSPVATSVESSQRIETAFVGSGSHMFQVQSPNGQLGNVFTATLTDCAFTVSGVSPSSGPPGGGTTVSISGAHFTGATGVNFGSNPAASFTVDSDSHITAVSPPGSGTVDVTVSGPGGTSATGPSDHFSYVSPPPPPPPPPSGPPVVGGPLGSAIQAVPVGTHGAAFAGDVNPDGLPATGYFQYGLDKKYLQAGGSGAQYDQQTPAQPVGSDFSSHPISATVSGLVPNALYHARLVASNGAGTTYGPDQTFMTGKDPAPPAPVLGKSFDVTLVSGIVWIHVLGAPARDAGDHAITKGLGFVPLTEARQLPAGSQIDARQGTIQLITATQQPHKTQNGNFGGGLFGMSQDAHGMSKGLTTLSLLEGLFPGAPSYSSCTAKATDSAGPQGFLAALSSKVLQTLHGSDHGGRFKTKGRYGAATVRGTVWAMSDRCDGTLTTVQRGTVTVNDFVRHITLQVHQGHQYLARAAKKGK